MAISIALSITFNVLYYIGLPVVITVRLLLAALIFFVAPILLVARYLYHGVLWPIRQLARFETLFIYFGVAALLGICTAAVLHYSMTSIVRSLGIDTVAEKPGRTLSSYRADKKERQARKKQPIPPRVGSKPMRLDTGMKEKYSDWLRQDKGFGTRSLLATTILEEEDGSEAGF